MTQSILEFSIEEVCEILKLHVESKIDGQVGEISAIDMSCDECDDEAELVFQVKLL